MSNQTIDRIHLKKAILAHLKFKGEMDILRIAVSLGRVNKKEGRSSSKPDPIVHELIEQLIKDGSVSVRNLVLKSATYTYYSLPKPSSIANTERQTTDRPKRDAIGCLREYKDSSLEGSWKPSDRLVARTKDAIKRSEADAQKELLQRLEEKEKEKKSRKQSEPKPKTKPRVKRSTEPKTSDRPKSTTKAKTKVKAKAKPKVANQDKSKRQAAEDTLDCLIAIGKPFTIKEWAAQAGCTDALLYKTKYRDLLEKARSFSFASASKMGDLLQALEELKQENRPIAPKEVTDRAGVSRHIFHRGHYDEIRELLDQWNSRFDPIEWNPRTKQIHDRLKQALKELVEIGEVFTLTQWAERAGASLNTVRSEFHSDLKRQACEEIDRLRQVHGPVGPSQISKGRKALERSLDYLVSLGKPFTIKKWAEMAGFSATLVYADSVADLLAKAKEANDRIKAGRKASNVVEIDANQSKEENAA